MVPSRPCAAYTSSAASCFAGATLAFVAALRRTGVANVFVIVTTGPLLAAIFAKLFLRERVAVRTWVEGIAVVAGLAWVGAGSLRSGHLDGDLIALAGAACFAGYLTVARGARDTDMTPAIGVGGGFAAAIALGGGVNLAPAPSDLAMLSLLGLVVLPAALALTTRATRYLPAAEVALVNRLETILAPLWVWIVLGEAPRPRSWWEER